MARLKEFDPDSALTAAVEIFWRNGFEKTSLDDLVAGTGVARQSLYDTFGDKRALYLRALDRYRQQTQADMQRLFASGRPIRDCFAEILGGIAAESRAGHERGCLLVSANLERDRDDKDVAALVRRNQDEVTAIFEQALREGRRRGELSREKEPAALAKFFLVNVQGMRVAARAKSNREALDQIASVALSILT